MKSRAWLAYALVTTGFWGVWGAFTGLPANHGFPETMIYVVWALTMIPPALYALRRVGWGRTTTYGALATEVGAGREAARDVGQAMARNPAPLIIPCHRVLAAGGKIGGFSAPGGSRTKLRMLELEGVRVQPPETVQRSFCF